MHCIFPNSVHIEQQQRVWHIVLASEMGNVHFKQYALHTIRNDIFYRHGIDRKTIFTKLICNGENVFVKVPLLMI